MRENDGHFFLNDEPKGCLHQVRGFVEHFTRIQSCSQHIQPLDTTIFQPIPSMYGIFPYNYHKNQPHVGKYTIHGWYGQ